MRQLRHSYHVIIIRGCKIVVSEIQGRKFTWGDKTSSRPPPPPPPQMQPGDCIYVILYPLCWCRVRFHDVRLAARGHASHPSRADRTIDLAHVFERRRAILDSAIVRILKKEKQMSMDNIAHRVSKGVWSSNGVKGGVVIDNALPT